MPRRPWSLLIIAIPVLLLACSSAPPTSQSNQSLIDARANIKASDFSAALNNLDKAIRAAADEPSRQQAAVLRTALVTALADANREMGEAYYTGVKTPAAQANTGPFLKMRSAYYITSRSNLMDAMQSVMDMRSKLSGSTVPVEVSFPGFTGENSGLAKIKSGRLITDSERLNTELQADRDALAVVLSSIAGAGPDPNKGQQLFSSGKVEVDPRVFLIEESNSFLLDGAIFEAKNLNDPDRLHTVNEVVHGNLEVAQKLLTASPNKDLEARLKKVQSDCDKPTKKQAKS